MTLLEKIILDCKEEGRTKEQVEDLFTKVTNLRVDILMLTANLEKEEARFMVDMGDESVASRKVQWKQTASGQRLIECKRYITVTQNLLASLRTRIYSLL